jgi:hypothetical protein
MPCSGERDPMAAEKQVHTATCWCPNNRYISELCFDGGVGGERVKRPLVVHHHVVVRQVRWSAG